MILVPLIPLSAWLLTAWLVYLKAGRSVTLREALLVAATAATAWLVLGVELLSLFHAIEFLPILLWWGLPVVVLAVLIQRATRVTGFRPWPRLPRLGPVEWILVAAIALLLGCVLCQAIASPPNNIDSQEYHLPRQIFWIQQRSVEHFPCTNLRQVAMPPLTEYGGVTLMVLSGGDRWHNLLQVLALVLSLCAVSLCTRRHVSSARGQLLAALWVLTIPVVFLQASSTKNDVVVVFWTCLLAYWILLLATPTPVRLPHFLLIGIAAGALLLTKGTGLLFALPLAAWAAVLVFLHHRKERRVWAALACVVATTLALNAPTFVRNHRSFGTIAPDGPGVHDGPPLGNEDRSFSALVSNVARNLGPHCVTPWKAWNAGLEANVRALHEAIGRHINDPRTTWMPGGRFRNYTPYQTCEDRASAPAHLALLLTLPLIWWWARPAVPWPTVIALVAVALAGFVLFSWLLKWQYWHVRLIIPLPALLAPLFGWAFGAVRTRHAGLVAAGLLIVTIGWSVNSLQRPLWGERAMFAREDLSLRLWWMQRRVKEYEAVADFIAARRPATLGFYTGPSHPDYPLQRLLLDKTNPAPQFVVFNERLAIPHRPSPPPDLLVVARFQDQRLQHKASQKWYRVLQKFGGYSVFAPE